MPYRRQRRKFSRALSRRPVQVTQHNEAEMNQARQSLTTAAQLLIGGQAAGQNTGTSTTLGNRGENIDNGSHVNFVTIECLLRKQLAQAGALVQGFMQFCIVKKISQTSAPSSGDIDNESTYGLQKSCRQQFPGRVLHFSQVPVTSSEARKHIMKVNLRKFRMSKFRQGDQLVLYSYFTSNAASTAGSWILDTQWRFKEYK